MSRLHAPRHSSPLLLAAPCPRAPCTFQSLVTPRGLQIVRQAPSAACRFSIDPHNGHLGRVMLLGLSVSRDQMVQAIVRASRALRASHWVQAHICRASPVRDSHEAPDRAFGPYHFCHPRTNPFGNTSSRINQECATAGVLKVESAEKSAQKWIGSDHLGSDRSSLLNHQHDASFSTPFLQNGTLYVLCLYVSLCVCEIANN